MTNEIDHGGHAFPIVTTETNEHGLVFPYVEPGMTLRDWFAATITLGHEEPGPGQAQAIMGESPPNWHADPLVAMRWWMDAEAKFRYFKADAMIAARKDGA